MCLWMGLLVLTGCGGSSGNATQHDAGDSTGGPGNNATSIPVLSAPQVEAKAVTLSWTAPIEGIAEYQILRDGGSAPIAVVTTTSFTDTAVQPSTSYVYQVIAITAAGSSVASKTISVTTPDAVVALPSIPSGLTVTSENANQAQLSWSANTTGSAVLKYQIFRSDSTTLLAATSDTRYTDITVAASTKYGYQIRAIDAVGNVSGMSTEVFVTTPMAPDITAPSTPSNLTGKATSINSIDLTWSASVDDVAVTRYRVYRNGSATALAEVATTKYTDASVSPNTTYTYQVRALDAVGNLSALSTAVSVTTPAANNTVFVHPGILVSAAELQRVKSRLFGSDGSPTNAQPWTQALNTLKNEKSDQGTNAGISYASLSWTPHPVAYVGCGPYNNPDEGCSDEIADAMAAYAHALLWYLTGDAAHAQKSIEILNAWSSKLIDHKFDTTTYTNGLLVAAWAGQIFPKAAEIIRYTYTPAAGEVAFDASGFSHMLRTAILPRVINGWMGGGANWLLSMADATMNVGIFLDDKTTFDSGVAAWRAQVPATIYMAGDMNRWPQLSGLPISPPGTVYDRETTTAADFKNYWKNPGSFSSGLEGETCRDLNHAAMGFAAMFNAAETAHIQGVDLWGEQKDRITTAMEKNTAWMAASESGTNPPPAWPCPNAAVTTNGVQNVTWEIAFNHYAYRLGMDLPNTAAFLANKVRPFTFDASGFVQYETLTHYQQP